MSNQLVQLNYDELAQCVKKFHDEGEDIAMLHMHTRQRVQELRSEWTGEAADAFFTEMEEVLPMLSKVGAALITSQDVLNKVMQIIHDADEDTVTIFRSGIDFSSGGRLAGFTLDNQGGGKASLGGADGSTFQQAASGKGLSSRLPEGVSLQDVIAAKKAKDAAELELEPITLETPPEEGSSSAGGGGGGAASSQGVQGNLEGMGAGMSGGQPQHVSSVGSSLPGAENLADHSYGEGTGGVVGNPTHSDNSSHPSGGNVPPSEEGETSEGAAAVIGAGVASGAAKAIKESKKKK